MTCDSLGRDGTGEGCSAMWSIVVGLATVIVCYLNDFVIHARELPAILWRQHLFTKAQYRGKRDPIAIPTRVALLALLPSEESIPFTFNLLEALLANNFFVVAVSNKTLAPGHRDALLLRCHHLIERFPIGRDFGSYKFGLFWLKQHGDILANADMLMLANDSMFYPACTESLVSKLINRDEQWLCLFENFEVNYHAQAFFQIFRREVFDSVAFKKFWKRYVPFSSRTHAIARGEAGLTRTLIRAGFFAWPFYNALDLAKAIRETIRPDAAESESVGALLMELYGDGPQTMRRGSVRSVVLDKAVKRIEELMHNSNPTHSCGLIANVVMGAPIKRDVSYRGAYDMALLLRSVKGFTPREVSLMYADLRKRGVPATITGFRRMLFLRGRI
jgi:hypothetical protein